MPRPTGAAERELNERIAALVVTRRRAGHDPTLRVSHVEPTPVTAKERRERDKPADYPGWQPQEKECRREACGNVFLPGMPSQAYCSIECRDEATRAQRRITDRGKRERRRERLSSERNGTPYEIQCSLPGCEVMFEPLYPRSRYCSEAHKAEAAKRSKRRHRRGETRTNAPMTTAIEQELDALLERAGTELTVIQREYVVMLWKRANEDPDCPTHVYDRLESILGIPAAAGSTMPRADDRK